MQTQTVQTPTLQSRMKNPTTFLPGATEAIQALYKTVYKGGVSPKTLELVHLRASQINGCSFCVNSGALEPSRRAKLTSDCSP